MTSSRSTSKGVTEHNFCMGVNFYSILLDI